MYLHCIQNFRSYLKDISVCIHQNTNRCLTE